MLRPVVAGLILRVLCAAALAATCGRGSAADYVVVRGGSFASVVAGDASGGMSKVDDFVVRVKPVTRGEYLAFVKRYPQWSRSRTPSAFADAGYLSDWTPEAAQSAEEAARPVTHVSWFAAQAFCEHEGARLPTWNEWEFIAAADETRADARGDERWRADILSWYARPSTGALSSVGGPPNVHGVRDLHGLVWEWVDDFNALLVDADSRSGSDPDKLKFCGAGAINLKQRENYAVLMRIALLSSLRATASTGNLGFRCARPLRKDPK